MADISHDVALRMTSGDIILPIRSSGISIRNTSPTVLTRSNPAKTQTPKPRKNMTKSRMTKATKRVKTK